jgi:hypothetical protein
MLLQEDASLELLRAWEQDYRISNPDFQPSAPEIDVLRLQYDGMVTAPKAMGQDRPDENCVQLEEMEELEEELLGPGTAPGTGQHALLLLEGLQVDNFMAADLDLDLEGGYVPSGLCLVSQRAEMKQTDDGADSSSGEQEGGDGVEDLESSLSGREQEELQQQDDGDDDDEEEQQQDDGDDEEEEAHAMAVDTLQLVLQLQTGAAPCSRLRALCTASQQGGATALDSAEVRPFAHE